VSTWKRYVLFQVPGWIIAGVVATGLWHWGLFPAWLSLVCFSAWVVKDFMLFPLVRKAYETTAKTGADALVGSRGIAEGNLAPEGYVRIRGELWRAVSNSGEQIISSGTEVEILGAEGMKVFVRPVVVARRG
jgi:membrane protein implicated in regulation of membrane protease activity